MSGNTYEGWESSGASQDGNTRALESNPRRKEAVSDGLGVVPNDISKQKQEKNRRLGAGRHGCCAGRQESTVAKPRWREVGAGQHGLGVGRHNPPES